MEIQLGYVLFIDDDNNKKKYPVANLGFRFQKPTGGLLFKISTGSHGFVNVELGYSF